MPAITLTAEEIMDAIRDLGMHVTPDGQPVRLLDPAQTPGSIPLQPAEVPHGIRQATADIIKALSQAGLRDQCPQLLITVNSPGGPYARDLHDGSYYAVPGDAWNEGERAPGRRPARPATRLLGALGAAGALAAVLAGCSATAAPSSPKAAATAWLAGHAAPAQPGTSTGIVLHERQAAYVLHGNPEPPPCRYRVTSAHFGPGGPFCAEWSATVLTPEGRTVRVTCGDLATGQPCPAYLHGTRIGLPPWVGDYIRFPVSGQVTSAGELQVITPGAVPGVAARDSDDDTGFYTPGQPA